MCDDEEGGDAEHEEADDEEELVHGAEGHGDVEDQDGVEEVHFEDAAEGLEEGGHYGKGL